MINTDSSRRVAGFCGFTAVILYIFCWMCAALADPDWVLGDKSLSRMGLSEVPLTRLLFSVGCIITGSLGAVFAWTILKRTEVLSRISGVLMLVGCVALIGVALFPIDDSVDTCIHDVFCMVFFSAAMVGIGVYGISDIRIGDKVGAAIAFGLIGIFVVAYFTTSFGVYEAIGVLCILVWLGLKSVMMMTGRMESFFPAASAVYD